MKQTHRRKMIAPIVISVLLVLYLIGFILLLCFFPELPLLPKLLGVAVLLAFLGVLVFVLTERIEEIRSGEEDDLSHY